MIEIKDIHKSFADKEVLKGISAVMDEGACNLIIGKSGAGKTVLMKCVIGLFLPDKGDILYNGKSTLSMSKKDILKLRRETGMLFQGSALFDSMTVLDNVMFPLRMFANMTNGEMYNKAMSILDRVGLADAKDKYPSEISGGMMKRVAIARAISLDPKYLFCDEPNSGLDPTTSLKIDKLIQEITKEKKITTIVNTHDMNTVKSIGDQVLFVDKGLIEWRGSSANILTEGSEKVKKFIQSIDL